jgi:hypothetical protein
MAKKPEASPSIEAPTNGAAEPAFVPAKPIPGFNLAAKFAEWSPKHTQAPIAGILFGLRQLPSAQENQEFWPCYVVELTASTEVIERDEHGQIKKRYAHAGETVLITQTAALRDIEPAALNPQLVFVIYLESGGEQKVKKGPGKFRKFKEMIVGRPYKRTAKYSLPSTSSRHLALPPGDPFPGADDVEDGAPF